MESSVLDQNLLEVWWHGGTNSLTRRFRCGRMHLTTNQQSAPSKLSWTLTSEALEKVKSEYTSSASQAYFIVDFLTFDRRATSQTALRYRFLKPHFVKATSETNS
jgi:hypothetical protein